MQSLGASFCFAGYSLHSPWPGAGNWVVQPSGDSFVGTATFCFSSSCKTIKLIVLITNRPPLACPKNAALRLFGFGMAALKHDLKIIQDQVAGLSYKAILN